MKTLSNVPLIMIIFIVIILLIIVKFIFPFYQLIFSFIWRITFPFIIAIIISYLLYPVLNKLMEIANMHKTSAIVVIFLSFFGSLTAFIYKGFPIFFNELQDLSLQLPHFITMYEQMIMSLYQSTSFFPEAIHHQLDSIIINFELTVESYVKLLIDRLIHLFDDMISFIIIPVLVFYILKDFTHIRDYIYRKLPENRKDLIDRLLGAIHDACGTYIRGQMMLSFFIFTITFLLFKTINLKYAFVLSIFAGIMNIIPYFGPIIGAIPAIIIAIATSWKLVIYVSLIAIFVQLIEGTLLSPYIMGKTAQLHPIVIIFILLVSSELAGIVGMIIAIPFVMILKAIYLKLNEQKQQCIDN